MQQRSVGLRAELQEVVTSYRLLFDESGLPGLRFVLGFHLNPRRLAWLVLYATLFLLTMRDTHRLLAEYYAYEDRVNQDIMETKQVQFPAVTICNMNPWRKSMVCSEESFVSKSAKALIDELCNSVPRNVTMSEEDLVTTHKLKTWISAEQRRNLSRAERLGHQIEDMIIECQVPDGDCLNKRLLELRLVPRYGNCYCLGCNSSRFSWPSMQMSDPDQGLRMSLNMEPEEFLPLTVDAGFYVMVNQAGVQEEVFDNAVYVPPGATTYIGVVKSTSKNLEPPYKNPCQNDWPEELKKYVVPGVVYTKRACDEYCYQVHIFETCGCRSYNHIRVLEPRVMESPVCPDMLKGDCERAVEAQILQKLITCKCLTACEIHYYDTSPSSLAWASHLVKPEYILQEESPDRKKIHARIQIYMKTTKVLFRRKEPKSTVASLFRSIGGLMGVYLGYSSLHIFHVLDVLVDGAWSSLSRILARRRRDREARQEFHTKSLGDEYVLTRFQ